MVGSNSVSSGATPPAHIHDIVDDHLRDVLGRLSPRDFARAQAVCRRFREVALTHTFTEQPPKLLAEMVAAAKTVPALAAALKTPGARSYLKSTPSIQVAGKSTRPEKLPRDFMPPDCALRLVGPVYLQEGAHEDVALAMCRLRYLALGGATRRVPCNRVLASLRAEALAADAGLNAQLQHWVRVAFDNLPHVRRCAEQMPYPLRELIAVVSILIRRHEALDPLDNEAQREALRLQSLQTLALWLGAQFQPNCAVHVAAQLMRALYDRPVVRGAATADQAVFSSQPIAPMVLLPRPAP